MTPEATAKRPAVDPLATRSVTVSVTLPGPIWAKLSAEARRRRVTDTMLATDLVKTAITDDLFKAVLD